MIRMKLIRDIFRQGRAVGRPVFSLEFFPPKTADGEAALFNETLPQLLGFDIDFCSVTYGAGGGTRDKTLDIVERIQREHSLTTMSHLTCVGATRAEIATVVADAARRGIRNLLALRGDPPPGSGEFRKAEGGFEFAHELVRFLHEHGGFSIGTAGFPEGHMACREGKHVDWDRLKAKVDAGADFVLTQLFFDNADYFEFRDDLVGRLGVTVPICPGVIPIQGAAQIKRFTTMCGARIPAPLLDRLDQLAGDEEGVREFGIDYATRQCQELLAGGAPGIHFYTLNKARSTAAVLQGLTGTRRFGGKYPG